MKKNSLEKFAFWNEALNNKKYDLNAKNKDAFKVHIQKCGVCGSSMVMISKPNSTDK